MARIIVSGLPGSPHNPMNALRVEMGRTAQAMDACGIAPPQESHPAALFIGVGSNFWPSEFPNPEDTPQVSAASRAYLAGTVRTEVRRLVSRSDERVFALAHSVGRLAGASFVAGALARDTALCFGHNTISADGYDIAHQITQGGRVVEYGMGLNGTLGHIDNVLAGKYTVYGIHRSRLEVTALQGLVEYFGISSERLQVVDGGIARRATELVKNEPGQADVLVASRVHSAPDLRDGIKPADKILRAGGLVVARGARRYSKGFGYDGVAELLLRNPNLTVSLDASWQAEQESSRIIVAQKK